jgi:hypothetical protein
VREKVYQLALGGHKIEIFFRSYMKVKTHNEGRVDRTPHFRYASVVCKEIRDPRSRKALPRVDKTRGMSLLSGVCRQLYLETATLAYKLNDFTFRTHNTMFNFIFRERRLRPQQLEAITELTVKQDLPSEAVLSLLPNLRRVQFLAEEQTDEKKPFSLRQKRMADWSPPSGGWYRVVEGRKGRKLEKELPYKKNWLY